jgi:hypothetical protein
MMRWLFGVLKIILAVFIVGFAVNAVLAFTPGFKAYQGIVGKIKEVKDIQPVKDNNENLNSVNKEDNISNENKNPESTEENSQPIGSAADKGSSGSRDDYFMTFSEVNSIENINMQDKLLGLSIISKIKKDDLQKIYKLSDGGITIDELKELKKILDRNLCKSDIEKLDDLLMKNKKLFAEGKLEK